MSVQSAGIQTEPRVPEPFEYTVGLICCTHDEYIAISEILDDDYGQHSTSRGNKAVDYIIGRIGTHDVVVRVPPARSRRSETLFNACEAANTMKKTFTSVRFVLAIGVARGAPNQPDVCVGDVVISTKTINYRSDATVHKHKVTDALGMGITMLQHRLTRQASLETLIDTCAQAARAIDGRFQHPRLGGNNPQSQNQPVKLHYGTVAMVGLIVRDAQLQLNRTAQDDVLCFGTAFADEFPSVDFLSIYGINSAAGDNPDGTWDHYAAFAAAVCAKELLLSLYKEKKRSSEEVKLREVQGAVDAVKNAMRQLGNRMNDLNECMNGARDKIEEVEFMTRELEAFRKDLQEDLADAIGSLEDEINRHLELLPSKYVTREEWKDLQATVSAHSEQLGTLLGTTQHLLDVAPGFLKTLAETTNNKDLGMVATMLEKLKLGELPGRFKSIRRNPTTTPSPRSVSDSPVTPNSTVSTSTDTAGSHKFRLPPVRTLFRRTGQRTRESTNGSVTSIPAQQSLSRQSTNATSASYGSGPEEETSRGVRITNGHSAPPKPRVPHSSNSHCASPGRNGDANDDPPSSFEAIRNIFENGNGIIRPQTRT